MDVAGVGLRQYQCGAEICSEEAFNHTSSKIRSHIPPMVKSSIAWPSFDNRRLIRLIVCPLKYNQSNTCSWNPSLLFCFAASCLTRSPDSIALDVAEKADMPLRESSSAYCIDLQPKVRRFRFVV